MRILHVNKFAYDRGGAEIYAVRTAQAQSPTHEVAFLGDPLGREWAVPDVRLYPIQVPDYYESRGVAKMKAAASVVWSPSMANRVEDVVKDFGPDIVHLHNYAHQLTSSVVQRLEDLAVPAVYTAHDYKLACPAYVANVRGEDCFSCSQRLSPKLVTNRCHKGSVAWSTVVAVEALVTRQKSLTPRFIIAPSQFMLDALRSSWVDSRSTTTLLRNPATPSGAHWTGGDDNLLYVGRLSAEKGVLRLVKAAIASKTGLVLAGTGPLADDVLQMSKKSDGLIKMVGHVDQDRLRDLRTRCRAQVIPSTWPENAPLSALEAAVDGVPLIATPRGGLPEIRDLGGRMSILNADFDVRRAIDELDGQPADLEALRRSLSWEEHLERLGSIYRHAGSA